MTDDPLYRLKTGAPPPDADARARALQAAMVAFEDASRGAQTIGATQGSTGAWRPTSIIQNIGRWIMDRRMLMGTVAAGALLFPLAAQLVWQTGPYNARIEPPLPVVKQEAPANEIPHRNNLLQERFDQSAGSRQQVTESEARPLSAPPSADQNIAGAVQSELAQESDEALVDATSPALSVAPGLGRARKLAAPGVMPAPVPKQEQAHILPYDPAGDRFTAFSDNPLKQVAQEPVSTFSIDVDTTSYAFVRRTLRQGSLPPADSVRVEEMINYFAYDYPMPESREVPFKPTVTVMPSPWNANTKLMHVAIQGLGSIATERPPANLVFLLDVSGSMQDSDKLPLLKNAFRLLLDTLAEDDTVSIVTYAGHAGTALEPTKVSEKAKILSVLDALESGGSTAGAEGIRQAYALAEQAFVKEGVNRVLLATDGDFNVGISDPEELKRFIEQKRQSGVFLSVLGFGGGNYNDALMQTLAQNGNGVAAYIDTLGEAQKVLVDEAAANLFPIAKDVKIQIEFNPAMVGEYRLIGYETRALKREDFNNDRIDAGELGAGHSVTAIYELSLAGGPQSVDSLRYQQAETAPRPETDLAKQTSEYAFVKLRYKLPSEDTSKLIELPVTVSSERPTVQDATDDTRFAVAVAAFGQKLRGGSYIGSYSYDDIAELAASARGDDSFGYRNEFVSLVRLAKSLDARK